MPSGKAVTNIRIATSESWKDKQTGDSRSAPSGTASSCTTSWARSPPSTCARARRSTSKASIRTRKWQDKEGKDRYTTEIIADEMQMLGGRGGGGGASSEPREPRSAARARPRDARIARPRPWTRAVAAVAENSTTTFRSRKRLVL